MADLGNLDDFLKAGSVSNLDWLEVDPAEYRKEDTLPRQNLDVVPDLEAAWAHEGEVGSKYVPNRAGAPRTMGDMGQEHGLLRASPADIRKTARLALLQSDDPGKLRQALLSRYDRQSLQAARSIIAEVLAERGLLGRVYVAAEDFPSCHTGSAKASQFVQRFAREAKYLVAKPRCAGCVHAHQSPTGGETCSVFHKEIQIEVPYSEALAEEVEAMQEAKGRALQATAQEPRERIRLAMLAPLRQAHEPLLPRQKENVQRLMKPVAQVEDYQKPIDLTPLKEQLRSAINTALLAGRFKLAQAQQAFRMVADAASPEEIDALSEKIQGVPMPELATYRGAGEQRLQQSAAPEAVEEQLIAASNLTRKRDEEAQKLLSAKKAEPVIALLKREMLKGRAEPELIQSLKHAFTGPDLQATREHWEPLFKEAGLFGVIYSTQNAFSECREGADFLAKHNPGIRAMVAGKKCEGCIYNKLSRCLMYGKPLVETAAAVLTASMVEEVQANHKAAGRIAPWDSRIAWGSNPREALKNLHLAASYRGGPAEAQARDSVVKAFHGGQVQHTLRQDARREILATAQQFMNEGLYGRQLLASLKARFEPRDLVAAKEDLRSVLAEQGLQGIYFVDPTVYADYGRGCDEAARLHRTRGVPYLKLGSKCGSCVLQTNGHCSKVNKVLVADVPYPADKREIQREILASGPATETDPAQLVNNGRNMMAEFEVQNRGMEIDLDPIVTHDPLKVSFK